MEEVLERLEIAIRPGQEAVALDLVQAIRRESEGLTALRATVECALGELEGSADRPEPTLETVHHLARSFTDSRPREVYHCTGGGVKGGEWTS